MAMIQITPESLRQNATSVMNYKEEHDQTIRKLAQLVRGLQDTWKGQAQDAFYQKFESMQQTFTQFSEMLKGFADNMNTAAQQLESTDQSLKLAFSA